MVENDQALQDWSAFDNNTFPSRLIQGGSEGKFDYIASGVVLTGTGYGSTLGWSLTAGVVWINGKRYTVAAATGNVTASRDTYFDLLEPVSGTVATLVVTGGNIVTNNAASPALAANSVRVGIIQAGANIASVAAVNQGQENKVLPIASSIAYTTTDSLGNLICPRDPNRRILGYRQIITNFASSTTVDTQITGLSCPVIIPTGRKVKVSFYCQGASVGTANRGHNISLWPSAVGVGNLIMLTQRFQATAGVGDFLVLEYTGTPSSTTLTYNMALAVAGGAGTNTLGATAQYPMFIKIELM